MAPSRAVRSGRCADVEKGRGGGRRQGLSCAASARGCSRREMLLQASRAGAGVALCHGPAPSESFAAAVKVRSLAAAWRPAPRSALPPHQAVCAAPQGTDISAYLPDDPSSPGWIRFRPDPNKTPALRSGAVRPYSLLLPRDGGWKEQSVPNGAPFGSFLRGLPPHALPPSPQPSPATTASPSAQFTSPRCALTTERRSAPNLRLAPRCDEPTTEVKFASADEGTLSARTLQS
jgi:hypothetical protein